MRLLRLLCLLSALVPFAVPAAAQTHESIAADATLRQMLADQEAAWNRGDGKAWAAPFAEDADFINIRGQVYRGQGDIAQVHRMILAGVFKGSHAEVHVRTLRLLCADVALIETDHTVTGFTGLMPGVAPTSEGRLETHMKYVARKGADGEWKFVAAQNTAVLPSPPSR